MEVTNKIRATKGLLMRKKCYLSFVRPLGVLLSRLMGEGGGGKMKKVISIMAILAMLFGTLLLNIEPAVLAAGNGNTTNNDVTMDCSQCFVGVGEEKTITATVTPANDTSLKWKVSDPSAVYLVNKRGGSVKIVGLKEGTITITAYHGNGSNIGNGNKSVSCKLTVVGVPSPEVISPSLEAEMKAAQDQVVKPPSGNALGAIDVTLHPQGSADNETRQPVDIAFVVDVSSNMSTKLADSRNAIKEMINQLQPTDRIALIPFGADIDSGSNAVYALTSNFNSVITKVDGLHVNTSSSSNYTSALKKAGEVLGVANNRSKYVVFLAGGKPNTSVKLEYVGKDEPIGPNNGYTVGEYNVVYKVEGNQASRTFIDATKNSNNNSYHFTNTTISGVHQGIKSHILDEAVSLAARNARIFNVGIGQTSELDMSLLASTSEKTGGKTDQSTSSNLKALLSSFAVDMNKPSMTNIKFKLKIKNGSLGNNVQLPQTTSAYMEGDYAVLNLQDIRYNRNGIDPTSLTYSLPLEFVREGNYLFDDALIEYTGFNGTKQTYRLTNQVTVSVWGHTEPSFKGTMTLNNDQVSNLIIAPDNSNNNTFTINYSLLPVGNLSPTQTGIMKQVKLTQYLPHGLTVTNSGTGITVVQEPRGSRVEITFADVTFGSGVFNPAAVQPRQLQVRVDWALTAQLSNPLVTFKNTADINRRMTIQAPVQLVKSIVRLTDGRGFVLEGDEQGNVVKRQSGNSIDSFLPTPYPIKKLSYKENQHLASDINVIRIESRDVRRSRDVVTYLQMVPAIKLKGAESQREIDDDGEETTANEDVIASLEEFITDPNSRVTYSYKVTKTNSKDNYVTQWQPFDKFGTITLTGDGTYKLEIRGQGGFASGDSAVRVIKIDKNPNRPPVVIDSIPDQELFSGGERKVVDVSQVFTDPDLHDYLTISAEVMGSISIARVVIENNQPVIISGNTIGEVMVVVTARDNRGEEAIAEPFKVTVISPAPEFSLRQNGIIGDYVLVNVNPVPETIQPHTQWFKFDYDQEKKEWKWVEIPKTVALKNGFVTGITLKKQTVEGKLLFVNPQRVAIKAKTGSVEEQKYLQVNFLPQNNTFIDNSGIDIIIKATGEGNSTVSGNRAARINLSYKISLPQGVERATFIEGSPSYSIKSISNSRDVLAGALYKDGINQYSTPVVKFMKPSTGSSQQFDVEASVKMNFTTVSGETLPFELKRALRVKVESREKLQ